MILRPLRPFSFAWMFIVSALFCLAVYEKSCFSQSVSAAEEIRYEHGERRDPFISLVEPGGVVRKGVSTSGLNIEGIIYDPKAGSIALINGQPYKEGDSIDNLNLISILKDRIILAQDDEEKILWIREEIVEEGDKKHEKSTPIPPKDAAKKKP